MKTTYVIVKKKGETTNQETIDSIKNIGCSFVELEYDTHKELAYNTVLSLIEKDTTHISLIENNSLVKPHGNSICLDYVKDEKAIYLPLVEYWSEGEEIKFKGFLNSCLWKPMFGVTEVGKLDYDLAKKGFDLTLIGALIPVQVLKDFSFTGDIQYYSSLEFIARVVKNKVAINGIPKVVLGYVGDFELSSISKEDKVKDYELLKKSFVDTVSNV